ncbi:MAG TPA: aminotransferase class IV, partial [Flavisolibacter sp.]|nr:aminotransferase class IV [Flavisolibacter sp.]
ANFFLVTEEGRLVTPSKNILQGITRKKLLEMAGDFYPVEERDITLDELKTAREAFITSTTKQILPVRQIDEIAFTERKVSNHLHRLFTDVFEKRHQRLEFGV